MIQSVLKAIDALYVFSPTQPCLTLAQISERLEMPKSTVHNLLATLVARGFIEKVHDDYYALGTAVISLTQAARVNAELRDRAAPMLRELADITRESSYLVYLEGDHALYIYAIETSRRLMARSAIGDRVLLHCTSVGKAILATLPPAQVDEIIQRVGLPSFTENTITDSVMLFEDLELTRQRGYSIDNQEHEVGTFCLGAVIKNGHGTPIGACSISGTNPEIISKLTETLAPNLLFTAQEISRQMGFVPLTPASVVIRKTN